MQPEVSIVIPSFNRSHLLGETLDSIVDQNFSEWECLVIDDGSQDYTSELMEFYCAKDSRFIFYHRPKNRPSGANACRNYGFEKSRGKYINFFDSDDLIHPEKLGLQVRQLENKSFNFSVSEVTFFRIRKENRDVNWRGKTSSNDPLTDYIKGNISWLTPAVLWERNFLEGMDSLFDEELQASQEWEFHCRVLSKSPSYCMTETSLVWMRKHDENISYNSDTKDRQWNYFLARLKVYQNHDFLKYMAAMDYLDNYLKNSLKNMIRKNNRYSFKAFNRYVLKDRNYSARTKIFGAISIISFGLVGKGEAFLNQMKLKV